MSFVNMERNGQDETGCTGEGEDENETGSDQSEAQDCILPSMLQTCVEIGHIQHFMALIAVVKLGQIEVEETPITASAVLHMVESILVQRHERQGIYNSLNTLIGVGILDRHDCEHSSHMYCHELTDRGRRFVRDFGIDTVAARVKETDRLARQDCRDIREFSR